VEGESKAAGKPSPELGQNIAQAYKEKYKALGYSPGPDSWDGGGFYVITLRKVMAWTVFNVDPTKFIFSPE
jgi:hypothetical protein